MKNIFSLIALSLLVACASTKNKNETVISPYSGAVGYSALVYGLPQTRLYFEVEMVKTFVKRGPYAEYATRMLGIRDVPLKDSENWQIASIRIYDRQEVDNSQLYALSFIDYPANLDRLLHFTKEGLLMDLSADHVLVNSRSAGSSSGDIHFMNAAVKSTVIERVDTVYKTILTDTAFVKIPLLQRKVTGKSTEEQAREAAEQIFDLRKGRLNVITGNIDHSLDGSAIKQVLEAFDIQEEQLLSLFNGLRTENRYVYTYSALPEKAGVTPLFRFSEKAGIVTQNTAGAKEVWYRTGEVRIPPQHQPEQASNIVYYRIPQIVEISAGIDNNVMISKMKDIYQFGHIVSFPLLAPKKK
ncbi:MAG: DUF4831 family protein [Bacteroidales bacterium]|jgi:hypothetical protein|nr:DUF4831 family protein [Bacteroidales bacterium]